MTDLLQRALQPSLKMESKSLKATYELLAMETALLIATASSRDIDVSLWFGERANDGKIPVREFDAKIVSLASTVGINQDTETKRELELATSTLALRMIHTVCAAGEDEHGQLLIDASYFFKLCQEKVDKYLEEIDDNDHAPEPTKTEENFRVWQEGTYDILGHLIDPPVQSVVDVGHDDLSDVSEEHVGAATSDNIAGLSAENYIADLRSKAAAPRPQSAPPGGRAKSRGESAEEALCPSDAAPASSSKSRTLESFRWTDDKRASSALPTDHMDFSGDEKHLFADDDEETQSESEALYAQSRGSAKAAAASLLSAQRESSPLAPHSTDWEAENRAFLELTSHMPSKAELQSKSLAKAPAEPAQSSSEQARPRPSRAPRAGCAAVAEGKGPMRSRSADRTRPFAGKSMPGTEASEARRQSFSFSARRSSQEQGLPLSSQQLEHLKELVQDLLRDTVKKTDCYHLVQVHLGFVDSYTMVPPRGAIVQSQRQEWTNNRQIHAAFIAGRLFLNENQIKALKHLVADFAKQYRTLYRQRADELIRVDESLEEKLPARVFGPQHSLSSEWLRRYLLHLRLTKRVASTSVSLTAQQLNTSSIASRSVGLPIAVAAGVEDDKLTSDGEGERKSEKTPMLWKEWLGKKLKQEMENGPQKPKDLQKALNGQNHALSKDDIEYLLKTHRILPQEALLQEIECRIESWVLDTDGRRDFQHQLNVKIRTWIWEEMVLPKTAKMPRDEQGYWRIWQKLPKEKRSEIKERIIKSLVDEKREEFKSSERTKQDITKSLYWQFDAARREREIPWTDWLPNHFDKTRRNLDKFKQDDEQRRKIATKQKQRRKSMASLQAIESTLKDVGQNLNAHHQMQLQKGLVSLRRAAQENGLGKGGIVTKEEFDSHIRKILSPYVPLDETFLENRAMDSEAQPEGLTKFAEEWRRRLHGLFTNDPKETLSRVAVDENKHNTKQKETFESWLAKKKHAEEEQERRENEKKEKEARDKEIQKKKSEKAFKKWMKLRKHNKYKSMVDKKSHPVPTVKKADHSGRWNYDKEISRPPDIDNSDTR